MTKEQYFANAINALVTSDKTWLADQLEANGFGTNVNYATVTNAIATSEPFTAALIDHMNQIVHPDFFNADSDNITAIISGALSAIGLITSSWMGVAKNNNATVLTAEQVKANTLKYVVIGATALLVVGAIVITILLVRKHKK